MKRKRVLGSIVRSSYELKEKVKECGSHFFDPDAMRFFRSRLADRVYPSADGKSTYFVTSEQFESRYPEYRRDARKYTVRRIVGCQLEEIGKFQQYKTSAAAHRAAARAASRSLGRRR